VRAVSFREGNTLPHCKQLHQPDLALLCHANPQPSTNPRPPENVPRDRETTSPDFQPKHHRLEAAGTSSATETKLRDESPGENSSSQKAFGVLTCLHPDFQFILGRSDGLTVFGVDSRDENPAFYGTKILAIHAFMWMVLDGYCKSNYRHFNAAKCYYTFRPWLHQSFLFWTFYMKPTQVVILLIQMVSQSFSQLYSRALLWLTTLPIVATHSPQATRKHGELRILRPCLCQGAVWKNSPSHMIF